MAAACRNDFISSVESRSVFLLVVLGLLFRFLLLNFVSFFATLPHIRCLGARPRGTRGKKKYQSQSVNDNCRLLYSDLNVLLMRHFECFKCFFIACPKTRPVLS